MSIRREDLDPPQIDLFDVIEERRTPMRPTHPATHLRKKFLEPMGISAYRLARDIGVPLNRIAGIIAGRRAITADIALRFAGCLGTDAQSWINLQARYDLELARRASAKGLIARSSRGRREFLIALLDCSSRT